MQVTPVPPFTPDAGYDPAVPLLLSKLDKDVKEAARTLTPREARFLVDLYYQWQHDRVRQGNQIKALAKLGEPHETIQWTWGQCTVAEKQVAAILTVWGRHEPTGMAQWAQSICGIGPIIAAGLAANIDIAHCQTAGAIWAFAGLDPTRTWEKGKKRPWNASLKRLQFIIGESFVKVQGNKNDIYGRLFAQRKEYEWGHNLRGDLAGQAAAKLAKYTIGTDTDARLWYAGCLTANAARAILDTPTEQRMGAAKRLAGAPGSGQAMLPPAHIHARARRWTTKLFLSAYFEVAYTRHYGTPPPLPYPIQVLGHDRAHKIDPPTSGD